MPRIGNFVSAIFIVFVITNAAADNKQISDVNDWTQVESVLDDITSAVSKYHKMVTLPSNFKGPESIIRTGDESKASLYAWPPIIDQAIANADEIFDQQFAKAPAMKKLKVRGWSGSAVELLEIQKILDQQQNDYIELNGDKHQWKTGVQSTLKTMYAGSNNFYNLETDKNFTLASLLVQKLILCEIQAFHIIAVQIFLEIKANEDNPTMPEYTDILNTQYDKFQDRIERYLKVKSYSTDYFPSFQCSCKGSWQYVPTVHREGHERIYDVRHKISAGDFSFKVKAASDAAKFVLASAEDSASDIYEINLSNSGNTYIKGIRRLTNHSILQTNPNTKNVVSTKEWREFRVQWDDWNNLIVFDHRKNELLRLPFHKDIDLIKSIGVGMNTDNGKWLFRTTRTPRDVCWCTPRGELRPGNYFDTAIRKRYKFFEAKQVLEEPLDYPMGVNEISTSVKITPDSVLVKNFDFDFQWKSKDQFSLGGVVIGQKNDWPVYICRARDDQGEEKLGLTVEGLSKCRISKLDGEAVITKEDFSYYTYSLEKKIKPRWSPMELQ